MVKGRLGGGVRGRGVTIELLLTVSAEWRHVHVGQIFMQCQVAGTLLTSRDKNRREAHKHLHTCVEHFFFSLSFFVVGLILSLDQQVILKVRESKIS